MLDIKNRDCIIIIINISLNISGKMMTNSSSMPNSLPNFPLYAVALLISIILTGIIGNFLLIISHVKDPLKVIKSSSSYFIFNIALVDLLSACSLIFATLSSTNTSLYGVTSSLIAWFYTVSFTLYLNLAIQRLCSVLFPLWHRVKITTRVCRYWVTGVWLASIVLDGWKVIMSKTEIKVQTDLATLVLKWLMFFITQSLYVASCLSIRKQNSGFRCRNDLNAATKKTIRIHLKNESNFVVTIAIVSILQGVSSLPYLSMGFIVILDATTNLEEDYENTIPSYYIWGLLGLGVNSAINVFIYIWRLPKYRKTFKKLYCR